MTSVDRPLSRPAQDIAEFLRAHQLFAELDARELGEIAQRVQLETFARGAIILSQDDAPSGSVRVVRRGSVDLIDDGRALDRLGPGELFGHPSMLSGLPVGFEVRAAEDTECLRLEAADAVAVLARPSGLRYVARTLLTRPSRAPAAISATADPARQRIDQLNREPPILCEPELPVRVAARRMVERGGSCALVRGERGLLGIVTDRDLRSRVLAAECSPDTPVAAVMSSPVVTAPPEGRASDAMLTMLDRGIRHLPIVGARGEILGVLRDVDLLAAQARTPFVLRRAIARAADLDELKRAVAGLNSITIALYDARMSPAQISGAISVIADALTRRLLELAAASSGTVGYPLAWLALGSQGRREAMPSSDLDSAVTWAGETPASEVKDAVRDVLTGMAECGFRSDPHGATASNALFARSTADWNRRIEDLLADPGGEKELILLSLLCDARVVTGGEWLADPFEALRAGRRQPGLRRLLLRVGLAPRPPTGFLRDLVVEHSGEHRGHLDIKHGGLLPLVNLARYGSFAAGSRATGTVDRLAIASHAGTLPGDTSASLHEAFELLTALRLEHQVEALRAGREPDDFIDPRTLNPLARRYLRAAFRAIASIQRTLGNELAFDSPVA
jgi:CBS domain-containing protein